RGSCINPKIVSLVPSEIATSPSRTRPVPIRLQGVSPDHRMTCAAGRPCRACQYGDNVPAMLHDGAIGGRFDASDGAVASTASDHHAAVDKSIRFVPEPSPGSIGACWPASSDARNELTR